MFGISLVALALTLVSAGVVLVVGRFILYLNAKRWALCERIRVLEGDLKHLRENPLEDFCQLSIKFTQGNVTDYREVITNKSRAERFVAEMLTALDANAADERELYHFFPHYFCNIKLSEVEAVQVCTVASERQWRDEGTISFVRHDTRWCRWSVFMRGLLVDLSLDGKNPISPDAFRILIGDEHLTGVRVYDWLNNCDFHSEDYRDLFTNIRKCVDAMKIHWPNRAPSRRVQFIRVTFPGNVTPILELLRTDEDTKRVLDFIAANSDLPKEGPACREAGPKEVASGTAS